MPKQRRVFVDGRRDGQHGIARFGTEVLRRLRTPSSPLGGPRDALSPLDVLNPHRLALRSADVVFSPGFHAGPTRATQLLTLHDLIQLQDPAEIDRKKALYYRLIVRPAVLRAGRVLTVSETSRTLLREWIDDAADVIDVGNGCSDVFFRTERAPEPSGLLYVGALKPHKNPDVVFAALAAEPSLRLTVVSNDDDDARRLVEQHAVQDRVVLRKGVSDAELAGLYAAASALVFPSRSEGFGLPAAEALAVGCPVLHWRGCAAVAEIVADDGVALEDADDVVEWRSAMLAAEAGRLPSAGRERIRQRYSWDSVAARVDEQIALV